MNSAEKSARVLVVDDTPSIIKLLVNALRDDYELFVATNGMDAVQLARSERPDIILLDVLMPGMDGYAVCTQLKAEEATAGIPVIFITALSDAQDETRGFALGAVDYVTKPISLPVLRSRVSLHLSLQQAQQELARAYGKLADELDLLADLQARLLPSETLNIPGLTLTTLYNPSGKASGDYFDYFRLNETVLRLLVADVAGHGSRAAFVMGIVRSLIRQTRSEYHTLSETMVQINEHLIEIIGEEADFVTMIAVDFNMLTGEIEYVNAGHCPGALRLGNGKVESLPATAPVLGFFKVAYPSKAIRAGNAFELLLYTDGLYEWRLENGEIYSHERFRELIEQLMDEGRFSLAKLEKELRAQAPGKVRFDDDLTALHIAWEAPSLQSRALRETPPKVFVVTAAPRSMTPLLDSLRSEYELYVTDAGKQCLDMARREKPDLILLDSTLPDMNGPAVCRALKEDCQTIGIPVCLMSAPEQNEEVRAGLDAGAADCLTTPFALPVALLRIKTLIDLKAKNERLETLAGLDTLTGLPNRRGFDEYLNREWRIAARLNSSLALVLMDVDHMRLFNESRGYAAGDDALGSIAGVLRLCLKRPADFFARYSCACFAIILPDTDIAGATHIAETIRCNVEALNLAYILSDHQRRLSASLGVSAMIPRRRGSSQRLIRAVEQALELAKAQGRNCCRCIDPWQG